MTEETELDSFLSDATIEEVDTDTTEVVAETETVEAEAETTGEVAEVEPEATTDEPPSSPESPPPGYVPQAALLDERSKRQELQDRISQLERTSQPKEEAKPIDFLDDPDAWGQQIISRAEQIANEAARNANAGALKVLESAARSRHQEDFDDVTEAFAQAAQQSPALLQEAARADDPIEFAYQAGKKLQLLNSTGGDLDALILRKQEEAIAAYLEKNPTPAQRAVDVPESLSTVTGSTARTDKEPVETPLESMFNQY